MKAVWGSRSALPTRESSEGAGCGRSFRKAATERIASTAMVMARIFQPISTKKVALKLEGGVGAANLKFYEAGSSSSVLGNQNSSQYIQSANHLNVHGGVGVEIFVTDHIFIRPQFDIHYVPNLTQFGSKIVTSEMVWIGYSLGDR